LSIEILYKNRGIVATLSAAYAMFFTKFAYLLRRTWKPLAAFVLLLSLGMSALFSNAIGYALSLLSIVPMGMWVGMLFDALKCSFVDENNEENKRGQAVKSIVIRSYINGVVSLLLPVLSLILYAVCIYLAMKAMGKPIDLTNNLLVYTSLAFMLLVLAVFCPIMHSFTTYEVTDTTLFGSLRQNFGKAFRRWGYTFATLFTTQILWLIVAAIALLPYLILVGAGIQMLEGLMMGDPVSLPQSYPWLRLLSALLGFSAVSLFSFIPFITYYYMYGSTVKHEREREKFNKMRASSPSYDAEALKISQLKAQRQSNLKHKD